MKPGFRFFAAAIFLAALLIIGGKNGLFGQAQPDHAIQPQATAGLENLQMDASGQSPLAANATAAPVDVLNSSGQLDLQQQITGLIQKAENGKAYPAGWYLLETDENQNLDAADAGMLPNGTAIPLHYSQQTWVNVDAKGLLLQQVTLMKTSSGEVFQAGVTHDGKTWNSTTGETRLSEPASLTDLLTGVHADVLKALPDAAVEIQEVSLDGIPVTEITLTERYQQPISLTGLDGKVSQITRQYVFDNQSGLRIREAAIATQEDGTLREFVTSSYTFTGPFASPPDEILNYLTRQ